MPLQSQSQTLFDFSVADFYDLLFKVMDGYIPCSHHLFIYLFCTLVAEIKQARLIYYQPPAMLVI